MPKIRLCAKRGATLLNSSVASASVSSIGVFLLTQQRPFQIQLIDAIRAQAAQDGAVLNVRSKFFRL